MGAWGRMQVESFNKAMSGRPSGTRLSRLFSGSKLTPPSAAALSSPSQQAMSLDDMLLSQPVGVDCGTDL